MDTLPQEKYFADLDQAVAEAAAKSEEALKAAQTEVTNLRQQLLEHRNHADAEAKMNERWRDAEAKLVVDLAAARERERAAQLKAEYMQKYNSLAKQNREQYNEKVSALRDEYRQKQQQAHTDRYDRGCLNCTANPKNSTDFIPYILLSSCNQTKTHRPHFEVLNRKTVLIICIMTVDKGNTFVVFFYQTRESRGQK